MEKETKAAGDKTQQTSQQPTKDYRDSQKSDAKVVDRTTKKPKIEKSNKDSKNLEEAMERLMDARNDFLEKIDEANEIDDESTADQANQLRDARSDSLTKFQAQWVEFKKVVEAELARQV